jgi:hypothetical protein
LAKVLDQEQANVNLVVDKADTFENKVQVFIDAVWYCRLLCSEKDVNLKKEANKVW